MSTPKYTVYALPPHDPACDRFTLFAAQVLPELRQRRPDLMVLYRQDMGRPPIDPVLLYGIYLFQMMESLPDRKAIESARFDVRWCAALELTINQADIHPTTLVYFRRRLKENPQAELAFRSVLTAMERNGYLKGKERIRIDSTHNLGWVADLSRLECVRETLRLALAFLEPFTDAPEPWSRWVKGYVLEKLDYKLKAPQLKRLMDQAGLDVAHVLTWCKTLGPAVLQAKPIALLKQVFEENFECLSGTILQRKDQPPRAVHNPHDPEAHWCKKGNPHREWVGYKTQVAETVPDHICEPGEPTPAVITSVLAQDATFSDKSALDPVLQHHESMTGIKPSEVYVDAGYTSGEALEKAEREGWTLHGPVQPAPVRGDRFSTEAFVVDIPNRRAVCPAQQASTSCCKITEHHGRISYEFEWPAHACQCCSMQARCLPERQRFRNIRVGCHHMLTQERRRAMKTEGFRIEMFKRAAIEGTHSELKRGYGFDRSRYRGLAKFALQAVTTAAVCNIRRWSARRLWEQRKNVRP